MKALFIIHCQDPIYGASRSVGHLIRNLDADVDIIFPVKTRNDGITPEQIKTFYGDRVKNVWFLPQPARLTIQKDPVPMQDQVKSFVKEILYFFSKFRYQKIYQKGNYDFIHLNSVTLYSMLHTQWPMFLHVREICGEKQHFLNKRFSTHLNKAQGIFFINKEAQAACPQTRVPQLVLINPYNQTDVEKVDLKVAWQQFKLNGTETVYAIIGNIFPRKGVDFVIKAFRKAKLENAVLLVVGADTSQAGYEDKVKAAAGEDNRIRFLGEIEDMASVYRVVDYVVRGDSSTGAGRTVFESVYSGGGAILMGHEDENLSTLALPPTMAKRVHFYPTRNQEELSTVFEKTQNMRFLQRAYFSNVQQYVEEFVQFIKNP